jgi:hypothetical protein
MIVKIKHALGFKTTKAKSLFSPPVVSPVEGGFTGLQ